MQTNLVKDKERKGYLQIGSLDQIFSKIFFLYIDYNFKNTRNGNDYMAW